MEKISSVNNLSDPRNQLDLRRLFPHSEIQAIQGFSAKQVGRAQELRMAIFGFTRHYWVGIIPLSGFALGWFLDEQETQRMTRFRDKSVLYGGPVDKPSW